MSIDRKPLVFRVGAGPWQMRVQGPYYTRDIVLPPDLQSHYEWVSALPPDLQAPYDWAAAHPRIEEPPDVDDAGQII